MRPDHVIIGSGINALVAAAMLSLKGDKVLVLERSEVPGGCLRSHFNRLSGTGTAPTPLRHSLSSCWQYRIGPRQLSIARSRPLAPGLGSRAAAEATARPGEVRLRGLGPGWSGVHEGGLRRAERRVHSPAGRPGRPAPTRASPVRLVALCAVPSGPSTPGRSAWPAPFRFALRNRETIDSGLRPLLDRTNHRDYNHVCGSS